MADSMPDSSYTSVVVESLAVGVVVIDSAGVVRICNSAAATILGVDPAQSIGRSYDTALAPFAQTELESVIRLVQKTGRACLDHEVEILGSDGERRTLRLTATPFATGFDVEIALTLEDITEQRRWAEAARRSDRLAALGQLAAGVAHEIRNPLTSIRGFAARLDGRYASIIVEEVDRLNCVVSALTEFSRPSAGVEREVDIGDMLEKALLLSAVDSKDRIRLSRTVDANLPTVLGDPGRLRQAMMNILTNAIQAMPGGGTLTVRAGYDERLLMVIIQVIDSGVGIPPELIGRVFDPFFTTKESGTGMGLAISHQILVDHGGSMKVESEVGQGTVVTLELPIHKEVSV